jgi:hypothetical protein
VVLDCYLVHREEILRAHAEELGIHPLFIPPRLADELQPLDRFAFGPIMGTCRRLWALHCHSDPSCSTDKKLVAAFLIRAWKGESAHVLVGARSVYDPALDSEQ